MNLTRLLPALIAGCCLWLPLSLRADLPPAFAWTKQYSADVIVTTSKGETITSHMATDNGKMRNETEVHGMNATVIMRPDQNKTYMVMDAQKMVMTLPYNPGKMKRYNPLASPEDIKIELVGPDTVDGTAGTKYKMTNKDGKVFFMWLDAAKQVPIKMVAEDGSVTIVWKNVVMGPQNPSLFEVPAGYAVIAMPQAGGMPMPSSGQ